MTSRALVRAIGVRTLADPKACLPLTSASVIAGRSSWRGGPPVPPAVKYPWWRRLFRFYSSRADTGQHVAPVQHGTATASLDRMPVSIATRDPPQRLLASWPVSFRSLLGIGCTVVTVRMQAHNSK